MTTWGPLPPRGTAVLVSVALFAGMTAVFSLLLERVLQKVLPPRVKAAAQDQAVRYMADAVLDATRRAAHRATRPFGVVRAR